MLLKKVVLSSTVVMKTTEADRFSTSSMAVCSSSIRLPRGMISLGTASESYTSPRRVKNQAPSRTMRTATRMSGRLTGYELPETVEIYAVEIENNTEFGEGFSPEVEKHLPEIV